MNPLINGNKVQSFQQLMFNISLSVSRFGVSAAEPIDQDRTGGEETKEPNHEDKRTRQLLLSRMQ